MPAESSDSGPSKQRGRLGRLASAVTGRVVETIDPDSVIEHIDINHLIDRLDVNRLLDRIDLEQLLDGVDIDALLDRVDINRLLDRLDVDRLIARVDFDAALRSVDVEAALRRARVPELVAEGTGQVAGTALDLARRQLVGLDVLVDRIVARILGRELTGQPVGPRLLTRDGSS